MPVQRLKARYGEGIVNVELTRRSGPVELDRPDGTVGELTQPGQPPRRVALQRRPVRDCIAEELRRLDADEIYEQALKALPKVERRARASAARKTPAKAKAPAKTDAKVETKTETKRTTKSTAKTTPKAKPKAGSRS
jgi:glucose-6-phosphate dehydrogenase assembly protein OpcA